MFHDSLNVERVGAIVDSGEVPAEAERRLVKLYREPDTLRFMVGQLNQHEAMRRRRHLIDRALDDYAAGRYDAVVLRLLTVMDGFVNDFEAARRGLHARDVDDMQAWDTVVGHHLGLAHAHKSFTKTISKTTDEECFELHRNGIMHGTILNYNNVIIATKAWNRLFAVADWATAREKQQAPAEPKPTFKEVRGLIVKNARAQGSLDAWRPREVEPGGPGYETEPVRLESLAYLTAWRQRNYGRMAASLPRRLAGATQNETAGKVRDEVDLFRLTDFALGTLHFVAAAACEVDVTLTINGKQRAGRLRWIRETPDGDPATPDVDGSWRLYLWGPMAIMNRAATAEKELTDKDELRVPDPADG